MEDREPVSVILPTVEWGPVCDRLAEQLRDGDELLVVCDSADDPVANRNPSDGVEILVAGEPEGCSGKANAMAHAMERAVNDRFVWTDDDYERDEDWLDRLVTRGQEHGPTSVLPYFLGTGWWWLFEPMLVLLLGLQNGLFRGDGDDYSWGGGVTFTRDELEDDVDALVGDLRTVLSDDNVLNEHLEGCRIDKSMTAVVRIEGDRESVYNRLVRWLRADHVRDGLTVPFALSFVVVGLAVVFPIPVAAVSTVTTFGMYYALGLVRWTFVLAYPGLLVLPVLLGLGIFRKECEWGGRRYRINDVGDVEVLEGTG